VTLFVQAAAIPNAIVVSTSSAVSLTMSTMLWNP
jgi:hypothetical protein